MNKRLDEIEEEQYAADNLCTAAPPAARPDQPLPEQLVMDVAHIVCTFANKSCNCGKRPGRHVCLSIVEVSKSIIRRVTEGPTA